MVVYFHGIYRYLNCQQQLKMASRFGASRWKMTFFRKNKLLSSVDNVILLKIRTIQFFYLALKTVSGRDGSLFLCIWGLDHCAWPVVSAWPSWPSRPRSTRDAMVLHPDHRELTLLHCTLKFTAPVFFASIWSTNLLGPRSLWPSVRSINVNICAIELHVKSFHI